MVTTPNAVPILLEKVQILLETTIRAARVGREKATVVVMARGGMDPETLKTAWITPLRT